MNLSCTLSPGPTVVDEAVLAEQLGYSRVWINHYVEPSEIDQMLVTPEAVRTSTFTAGADELRERVEALFAAGASEVSYHPAGPDIGRELQSFAAMAGLDGSSFLPKAGN